jgi:peroxiredoxin
VIGKESNLARVPLSSSKRSSAAEYSPAEARLDLPSSACGLYSAAFPAQETWSDKAMIKVGDRIPNVTLQQKTAEGIQPVTTDQLFKGKKVVMFAVPGAFTPTCSMKHLPGFVEKADAIKKKGVDTIACVSVNDAFVMDAWGKDQKVGDKVVMLADGSAKFAQALGLGLDLSERGLGMRSQRYAMVVEDGVVKKLNVEEAGKFDVSSADTILGTL